MPYVLPAMQNPAAPPEQFRIPSEYLFLNDWLSSILFK